jgi:hypothetical protein
MKIYKTPQFNRWARKASLGDAELCQAALEIADGLYEADLGGGLFKKRIARMGQGKRSGFRTLVAFNRVDRWVFLYGFAKNDRSNINDDEKEALKELADYTLSLTPSELQTLVLENKLVEIDCDKEKN